MAVEPDPGAAAGHRTALAGPVEAGAATPSPDRTTADRIRDRASRTSLAAWVFVAYLAAGGLYYGLVDSRGRSFYSDEWQVLSRLPLESVGSLFEDHNEHLIALPRLLYQALYATVGVATYWPYELLAVGSHLTVVALLRVVMRRSGVPPWPATIFAATLVFFGPGDQNIVLAFQITMTGALLFGLVQMLLADHAGGITRRDWWGLAAGLLALMCSGVALTMLLVVGVATLLRRGWRIAAFHVLPLVACFALWWLLARPQEESNALRAELPVLPEWLVRSWFAGFAGIAHYLALAVVLLVVTAVGWVVARATTAQPEFRITASMPVALVAGLAAFPLMLFASRAGMGVEFATSSRYLYVYAALLLPAAAYGVAALTRRWRVAAVALVIPLLGLLPNALSPGFWSRTAFTGQEQTLQALAQSPALAQAPGSLVPDPSVWTGHPGVTVDWLRRALADGRLPAPVPVPPAAQEAARLRLSLSQRQGDVPSGASCRPVRGGPVTVELPPQGSLTFLRPAPPDAPWATTAWLLSLRPADTDTDASVQYLALDGRLLTNETAHTLRLRAGSADGQPWTVCF